MTPWTTNPQILSARLVTQGGQHFNGVPAEPGRAVLLTRQGQTALRAWVNEQGHLLLAAPDAERYSLREDGHLVYRTGAEPEAATHDFLPEDFTAVDYK